MGYFWALAREAMICSNLPFCTMTGYLRGGLRNSPAQGQHKLVRSLRISQGGSRECVQSGKSYVVSWKELICSKMWRQLCRNSHRIPFHRNLFLTHSSFLFGLLQHIFPFSSNNPKTQLSKDKILLLTQHLNHAAEGSGRVWDGTGSFLLVLWLWFPPGIYGSEASGHARGFWMGSIQWKGTFGL